MEIDEMRDRTFNHSRKYFQIIIMRFLILFKVMQSKMLDCVTFS